LTDPWLSEEAAFIYLEQEILHVVTTALQPTAPQTRDTLILISFLSEPPMLYDCSTAALVSLVLQNAGMILVTKYTFREGAARYSYASVVLLSEACKLLCCLFFEMKALSWSSKRLASSLSFTATNLVMLVPATMYVLQNIFQFAAINGLSPAVYVTGAQLKVVSTAFFSVLLLKKRLCFRQIVSFVPLMVGVALVQLESTSARSNAVERNNITACVSLLIAITLSGLAGTLLELLFKRQNESIWAKNIFLSIFSLPSAIYAFVIDVRPTGDLKNMLKQLIIGFDFYVMTITLLLALGGMLTAMVMKYAGTLTKCYAVSISIVICMCASEVYGAQKLTVHTLAGSSLVVASVFLYAHASSRSEKK